MIQVAPGTKGYLACRPVSLRYGFDGLIRPEFLRFLGDHRRGSRGIGYFLAEVFDAHRHSVVHPSGEDRDFRIGQLPRWRHHFGSIAAFVENGLK